MDRDQAILMFAELVRDGMAMHEAALEMDWNEARFRCQLIVSHAADAHFSAVTMAAMAVRSRLGPFGTQPAAGYAEAMLELSSEIDALPFA